MAHNKTVDQIEKLLFLKKEINRCTPTMGFTIDISFGGNEKHDIRRVVIDHVNGDAKEFINLIKRSNEQSLDLWIGFAKAELDELNMCLGQLNAL